VVCQVWQDCEGLSLWVSNLISTIDAAPEKKRGPAILPKNGKDQAVATLCKAPFVVSASDSGLKASRQRGRGGRPCNPEPTRTQAVRAAESGAMFFVALNFATVPNAVGIAERLRRRRRPFRGILCSSGA
jgi:hypothetical protein